MRQIRHSVVFQSRPEVVFDYVGTLGHWPEWYPATKAVEGQASQAVAPGDTVVERVRKFGLDGRAPGQAPVTVWRPGEPVPGGAS